MSRDTAPDMQARYRDMLLALTPEERLVMCTRSCLRTASCARASREQFRRRSFRRRGAMLVGAT